MTGENGLTVAVVGLRFGASFVPIYQSHPGVKKVVVCDRDKDRVQRMVELHGAKNVASEYEEVLADDTVDVVHLNTGIPDHASQSVAALEAGKHCGCAVPMATSIEDIEAIINAKQKSGKNYMMMETSVYTRQFLHAKKMKQEGVFGRIQFLRGAHYQDMEQWPSYWAGLPPMWYATHAMAPLLAINDTRATEVHCFGSGFMRESLRKQYGNPFPIESAIFQLEKPGLSMEVTRSLYHSARDYLESFTLYGENACYEWQLEKEPPLLFQMSPIVEGEKREIQLTRPEAPDRADILPAEIARFTGSAAPGAGESHPSVKQGGGHHGSHPHLVHELITSITENRKPAVDEIKAANWTAAGICAHRSAMMDGKAVSVPRFQ